VGLCLLLGTSQNSSYAYFIDGTFANRVSANFAFAAFSEVRHTAAQVAGNDESDGPGAAEEPGDADEPATLMGQAMPKTSGDGLSSEGA
jgi:hypothetical protein